MRYELCVSGNNDYSDSRVGERKIAAPFVQYNRSQWLLFKANHIHFAKMHFVAIPPIVLKLLILTLGDEVHTVTVSV